MLVNCFDSVVSIKEQLPVKTVFSYSVVMACLSEQRGTSPVRLMQPVLVGRKADYSGDLDSAQVIMIHPDCVLMDLRELHHFVNLDQSNCIILCASG